MEKIASDRLAQFSQLSGVLEIFEAPAILLTVDYQILAYNQAYRSAFGEITLNGEVSYCYHVSHGYDKPCDQAGEDCPLHRVRQSSRRERILHIHQTQNGSEHVEIEMLPIRDEYGIELFIEIMRPIPLASGNHQHQTMVGNSHAFVSMLDRISKVGKSDATVLLLGESGTGKELAARAIHQASDRKDKPLITLECSGLTDALFESELFGYVKGAFTGANTTKQGLVELAHGGTLFLDEVADIPQSMQVKLLRLLENRTFRPLGSTEVKRSDFRLVCATHKNIKALVRQEKFRLDLFHRINVFPIHLPALKERLDDVPLISQTLLRQLEPEKHFTLTDDTVAIITQQPLKGNIRELRNILNRAIVLSETSVIDAKLIGESIAVDDAFYDDDEEVMSPASKEWVDLKIAEQNYISDVLTAHDGNIRQSADILGISVRSLYRKMREIAGKN
ncbi:sigma-54 interaction domain-containing protein [Aurantivibrio plasticivorans]